jgi:hypothetical protein
MVLTLLLLYVVSLSAFEAVSALYEQGTMLSVPRLGSPTMSRLARSSPWRNHSSIWQCAAPSVLNSPL